MRVKKIKDKRRTETLRLLEEKSGVHRNLVVTLNVQVEEVAEKISEDRVMLKVHSKAGVCKNILMKLHSEGGVSKIYFCRHWRHLLKSVIPLKYFSRHFKYNTYLVALPLLAMFVYQKRPV